MLSKRGLFYVSACSKWESVWLELIEFIISLPEGIKELTAISPPYGHDLLQAKILNPETKNAARDSQK